MQQFQEDKDFASEEPSPSLGYAQWAGLAGLATAFAVAGQLQTLWAWSLMIPTVSYAVGWAIDKRSRS